MRVMPSPEQIADTVNRYISLVAKGSADDLVELFADDATVDTSMNAVVSRPIWLSDRPSGGAFRSGMIPETT